jgi:SAM-dependent methyltransferase
LNLENGGHDRNLQLNPSLTEPFGVARNAARLMFDFGVMASLLNYELLDMPLLDFGAGTGWLSELFVRMDISTISFDIHNDLEACISNRKNADYRIDKEIWTHVQGDGHSMPFQNDQFGHICIYDSFHHMHDYKKVLSEMFRVLTTGGRAIFVEPGARHSSSPETIAFLESQKKIDPTWIERDVVLDEINLVAVDVGFKQGVTVIPVPHPNALQAFPSDSWIEFRAGNKNLRNLHSDYLSQINYDERIIFYLEKP